MPLDELTPGWTEDFIVRNDKNFKNINDGNSIEERTDGNLVKEGTDDNSFGESTDGSSVKEGTDGNSIKETTDGNSVEEMAVISRETNINKRKRTTETDKETTNKFHELLPGWTKEVKMRNYAGGFVKDTFYNDPVSGYSFCSKKDVMRYLATGDIKNCAMKPRKRDTNAIATPSSVTKDLNAANVAENRLKILEKYSSDTHTLRKPTGAEEQINRDEEILPILNFIRKTSIVTDSERNKAFGLQDQVLQQATDTINEIKQSSVGDTFSDPCINFAIKVLKGEIPVELPTSNMPQNFDPNLNIKSMDQLASQENQPLNPNFQAYGHPSFPFGVITSGLPTFNVPNHSQMPLFEPCADAINIHDLSQMGVPSNYSTFPHLPDFTAFMNNNYVDQSSSQSLFSFFNSQGTSVFQNENAGSSLLPSFSEEIVPQNFYPVLNSNPMTDQSTYQWSHSVIPPRSESFVLPRVNMASLSQNNVPFTEQCSNSSSLDQSSSLFIHSNVVDAAYVTVPSNYPSSQPSSSTR